MRKKRKEKPDEYIFLKLKYLRKYQNKSQNEFAEVLQLKGVKITYNTYTKNETNVCKPTMKLINSIASVFPDSDTWLKTSEGDISNEKGDRKRCKTFSTLYRLEYAIFVRGKEYDELAFDLHLKTEYLVEMLKTGRFKIEGHGKPIEVHNEYFLRAVATMLGLNLQWLLHGTLPIWDLKI